MDPPKNNNQEENPSNKDNNSTMASTLSLQHHYVPRKWETCTRTLDFSLRPVIVQTVKPKAATMNHSYRDFSRVPPMPEHAPPHSIADMTFSQKVHHMLSQEHYSNTITWMPHGRAFKVLVPKTFEKGICPVYFGHTRCTFLYFVVCSYSLHISTVFLIALLRNLLFCHRQLFSEGSKQIRV